ncbi:MAG: glycosyltransferase family 4 protein [Ignavibacteria bacterium]|nr:glycosyltransferase family 4 protein [Ignavibacteria bacterium]
MISKKITVIEISECFPNKHKPVTGEFILQHVRALSAYCRVITIVPLRYVPPKELLSVNPRKLISNLLKWYSALQVTKSFSEGNLSVVYFGYVSLPRPYLEFIDDKLIKLLMYNKLLNMLKKVNPGIIYCNWIKPWAELSRNLADYFTIPLIIDHHEDIPTLKKLFPGNYGKFLKSFEKADRIIVHSSLNKKELLNENLNLPEVTVTYLGQNFNTTSAEKIFNSGIIKILCVSHLYERRKNIDILIKAFSLIESRKGFKLTIAGDGVLKQEYIDLTQKLNLQDRIHFIGSKSQKELEDVFNESDIFVLPSYPEAFGIVFVEALAKGLPVITCEGNGGGEELKNLGYDIVLVKPLSPEEISKAILELSRDTNKMLSMSLQGKEIVNKYFTWDRNGLTVYDILKDTIKEFNEYQQNPRISN